MFEDPSVDTEIVLVGRSNVGKSTLMRQLTGHQVPVGRRPGVTREPNTFDWPEDDFAITDLPGFGFMSGVPEADRERIKTAVVQYLERRADNILVAVLVLDGKAVIDIIDRHESRGAIPHDVEFYHVCRELDIPTVLAVNKIDKVDDVDARLDEIAHRFDLPSPWQQWDDVLAPISAKRGQIEPLLAALRTHLEVQNRSDLLKYVTGR